MKRDWDVIREVLIEIESIPLEDLPNHGYNLGDESLTDAEKAKAQHAILLWRSGFVKAVDASSWDGDAIVAPELEWPGHDLLQTMRSKPVWEKIKSTSQEKGIELTFDSIKALGAAAVQWLLSN